MRNLAVSLMILMLLLWLPLLAPAASTTSDANDFWLRFRGAVINNQMKDISAMTRFPLEVRGVDDSMPIKYFNRNGFKGIFQRILAQPVQQLSQGTFVEKTMLQVVKEKHKITPKDFLTSQFIRIEQLEFQNIKGHWVFTGAYLEE